MSADPDRIENNLQIAVVLSGQRNTYDSFYAVQDIPFGREKGYDKKWNISRTYTGGAWDMPERGRSIAKCYVVETNDAPTNSIGRRSRCPCHRPIRAFVQGC